MSADEHGPPGVVREVLGGEPVTLVQLSTTFCAPCRHARVLLRDAAAKTSGLQHRELDLANHPELADVLGVHRTPTTIAYLHDGRELFRVGGVPRRGQLLEAVRPFLTS